MSDWLEISKLHQRVAELETALAAEKARADKAEAERDRLHDHLVEAADSLEWAEAHLKDVGVQSVQVTYGARDARAALLPQEPPA